MSLNWASALMLHGIKNIKAWPEKYLKIKSFNELEMVCIYLLRSKHTKLKMFIAHHIYLKKKKCELWNAPHPLKTEAQVNIATLRKFNFLCYAVLTFGDHFWKYIWK